MAENTYVLLDLVSIKVNTRTINNNPIVFCESITIKPHTQEDNKPIDWSNIIIGDPSYYSNITSDYTINISTLSENNGEYRVDVNNDIGLWSVILFETVKNGDEYKTLNNITGGSGSIGGTGTLETNIEEIYKKTDSNYTGNKCVNNFLKTVFNDTNYNGCIIINNNNCGLFLNISPIMFNNQYNLKSIALTNTITYISGNKGFEEVGVFSNCTNLESANIPKYLDYYFEYNNSVYDPKKTRIVPSYYFYNCNKLNNISIPNGIHNIEYGAFYGCDNVETINIPQSVVSIGSASLVTVNRSSIRYINVIGNGTPNNIQFLEESVGYDKKPDNKDGEKQYIENDVIISIDNRAEVKLSDSLLSENSSFVKNISTNSKIYINCSTITGAKFKTNNQGQQKYNGGFVNTKFNTIYIGPSVESICNFAFYKVTGTNLIIDNANVLATNYTDNSKDDSLEENKHGDAYLVKTPFVKSNFNSIHILNCGSIGQYALHTLRTGELKFFENEYSYEINSEDKIINTTLLKTLGDYAFYNSYFGEIITPSSVNSISNTSFLQTTGSLVLNCDISKYVTVIDETDKKHTGILVNSNFGEIAFNYNGSIPVNILYENKSINSIKLGEGITGILGKAFYLCTKLSNILKIPSTLTTISSDAFIGCIFSKFEYLSESLTYTYYQVSSDGMYLLDGPTIVLFANRHDNVQPQIVDNTFNININDVTGIGNYAFAYAFSDYANSNVYAVTIPETITNFGGNVFYNCNITRITFYPSNIPEFENTSNSPNNIIVKKVNTNGIDIYGSFSDLQLLNEVYIGYATGVLLNNSIPKDDELKRKNFLYNTLRNSYTNNDSDISNITIYVYEDLVDAYTTGAWGLAGYKIIGISKGVTPPPPVPPVENDDSYDADIDDPEGEEWPGDGGNGDITTEEDYIPPVEDDNPDTDDRDNSWIEPTDSGFKVPITQLGTPYIKVYGCILDLLNPTYLEGKEPENDDIKIIDQFGNVNFSALNYLKFNKVSDKTQYGSEDDTMLKLYMGDYGNNFLIVFTATGIDNFDATTKLFTSGVEYATHRESNWLKTEIVRITKKPESVEYYVVLLCTCLKLQNKDNYNCRTAIVSVNYGSQMLDGDKITTKIRVIQHKTELRLSNNSREINITDLPVLFCRNKNNKRTTFTGNFFIGFPKNFWSKVDENTISNDTTSANKNKLREYINDYFRILYDKEKIKVVGQKTTIDELDYTYIFDVADDKYANIKETGSTTSTLKKFSSCTTEEKNSVHEEYYYVNFKIENIKTSLAGGVWNISIYNIGEPAEMLNIQAIEDKTDIPSISVMFEGTFDVENYEGVYTNGEYKFTTDELNTNMCYSIDDLTSVRMKLALPTVVTGIPTYYEGNKLIKIYPSEELIDLCVDKSVVNMCGLSLLGNNMSGNVYNAFTTKIGENFVNLGVSSNNIISNSLNNIKFVSSGSFKQSLYNYKTADNTINRYDILQDCSRLESLIKTQQIGDGENEILENTETYIYLIDTGYSSLYNENTNTRLYNNYLFTEQPMQNSETSLHGETKLNSGSVEDKLNEQIQHNESSETGVYIEANNVLTDTYYNVLAPLYEYVYENTYNGVTSIDINPNVKLNDITHVYYCTSYRTDCVVNKDDKLYILKDNTNYSKTNEIWDNDNKRYKCGHLQYKLSSNNINVYPLYECKINGVDDNNNFEITVSSSGVNKIEDSNYFDVIIGENSVKSQRVIKIGLGVTYNGNTDISNKIVYKDTGEYKDINTGKLIGDIIRDAINKSPINIKEVKTYCYFIYVGDNPEIIDGYIRADNGGGSQVLDENKIKIENDHPSSSNYKYIIYKYSSGWYQIYNASGVHVTYNATPDENGNLNNGAVEFYKTRDITKIQSEFEFISPAEEDQLEGNKINIIPKELSSINPTLFRQIFYHLYYEINDNGKKIKVYDDNNNNAIMHLRLMNSYNYPKTINFSISNVFGIKLDNGYTLNSDNIVWQQPTITIIGKPQVVP